MSSTIEAAIIDTLMDVIETGGGGGGTPSTWTAGDAINISNRTISVKYDPNTMRLVDGKLSSIQSGSGGGGGGTSTLYTGGPGITVDEYCKISVKYNPTTLEIIDGSLSAKVSESGAVSEDVGVPIEVNIGTSSDGKILIRNIANREYTGTGMLLNMMNNNWTLERFVLVRTLFREADVNKEEKFVNGLMVPLFDGGTTHNVKVYSNDGTLSYEMEIDDVPSGTYNPISTENAFMRPIQLTTRTQSAITLHSNYLFWELESLIKYLEDMVETLKQKAGL